MKARLKAQFVACCLLVVLACEPPTEVFPPLSVTTASLASGVSGVAYSSTLGATGGDETYTWALSAGQLPAGLTLNGAAGQISGAPSAVGSQSFTVRVTSGDAQTAVQSLSIGVFSPLSVTTASLARPVDGFAYSATLLAAGGDGPYTWALSAGRLPNGLALNGATGQISGTPAGVESQTFTVSVTSRDGQGATKALALSVSAPLSVTTTAMANAVSGVPYFVPLAAAGGEAPYTWTLSAGQLPTGLTLDAAMGQIGGIPSAADARVFTVRVSSADGQSASKNLSVTVFSRLSVTTGALDGPLNGVAYARALAAAGGDGTYAWSVTSGRLPTGLTLNGATGQISGTPTVSESQTFTVRVASGDGQVATRALSMTVTWPPLGMTTGALAGGVTYVAYSVSLTAAGGDGVYQWSVVAGQLPAGLTLSGAIGRISGTPTVVESQTFTVTVTSGDGQSVTGTFSIGVARLVLTPGGLCRGLPGSVPATFANASLESKVRVSLGISASAEILCGELNAMADLEAANGGITSLLGLQNLHNLVGLQLWRNSIVDISPLSGLTNLTNLDLWSNSISDLRPLSGLVRVTHLHLDQNAIADLGPLRALTDLWTLWLHVNLISDVTALSGLTRLRSLWLHTNAISDIRPLRGLTSLERLDLSYNKIIDVAPLSGLTHLQYLRLGNNSITDLSPLAGLTSLEELHLSGNAITDLSALAGLTSVYYLALDNNPALTDIRPLLAHPRLGELRLGGTGVSCADVGLLRAEGVYVDSGCP